MDSIVQAAHLENHKQFSGLPGQVRWRAVRPAPSPRNNSPAKALPKPSRTKFGGPSKSVTSTGLLCIESHRRQVLFTTEGWSRLQRQKSTYPVLLPFNMYQIVVNESAKGRQVSRITLRISQQYSCAKSRQLGELQSAQILVFKMEHQAIWCC